MINIEKAKQLFDEFIRKYDMENPEIKRKYYHSLRVSNLCKEIAKSLNLEEEDQNIAQLIGLLHDIGRFNQVTKFHTYNDKISLNHGIEGYNILKENHYIQEYVEEKIIQDLVLKAVINHNKTFIDSDLNEREVLFCKMIRDADKLDIYSIWINDMEYNYIDGYISDTIYERILSCKVDYEDTQNNLDFYVLGVGLVFDIHFPYSYRYLIRENYMNKLIDKIEKTNPHEYEKLEKIRETVRKYLEKKKESFKISF